MTNLFFWRACGVTTLLRNGSDSTSSMEIVSALDRKDSRHFDKLKAAKKKSVRDRVAVFFLCSVRRRHMKKPAEAGLSELASTVVNYRPLPSQCRRKFMRWDFEKNRFVNGLRKLGESAKLFLLPVKHVVFVLKKGFKKTIQAKTPSENTISMMHS